MNRKREAIFIGIGILAGLALSGPAGQAANYLIARPSTQTFYINGQQAPLTAYLIGGSNYIRLRDIGKAVDFGSETGWEPLEIFYTMQKRPLVFPKMHSAA